MKNTKKLKRVFVTQDFPYYEISLCSKGGGVDGFVHCDNLLDLGKQLQRLTPKIGTLKVYSLEISFVNRNKMRTTIGNIEPIRAEAQMDVRCGSYSYPFKLKGGKRK